MNKILIVLKKELKETFRDKKSLIMMCIMPIIIPIFIIAMSYMFVSESSEVKDFNKVGFNYDFVEKEKEIAKAHFIDPVVNKEEELINEFNEGTIKAYVIKENNNYTVHYKDNTSSSIAYQLVMSYLDEYKLELQKEYLENHSIDPKEVMDIITVDEETTPEDSFLATYMTKITFIYIIMAITIASTYPATDATAGEKERGTLETLFTFPIKSKDIILGKYLSVATSSAITGLLSLILSEAALIYVDHKFEMIRNYNIVFNVGTMLFLVLVIILFSLLVSGITIAMASKSKNFKEAQSALAPLNVIVMLPGFYAFYAEMKTSILTSIIPLLNIHMIFNDVVSGNINILHISLMVITTILFIILILSYIIKQYKSEKTLFG